jgi:hypothetical protein
MQSDTVKRLMWQGLLAGVSALVGMLANRLAASVWRQLFDEEPPE